MIDLAKEEAQLRKLHLRVGILKFVRRCGGRCHLVSVRGNFNRHTDAEFNTALTELCDETLLVQTEGRNQAAIVQEAIGAQPAQEAANGTTN